MRETEREFWWNKKRIAGNQLISHVKFHPIICFDGSCTAGFFSIIHRLFPTVFFFSVFVVLFPFALHTALEMLHASQTHNSLAFRLSFRHLLNTNWRSKRKTSEWISFYDAPIQFHLFSPLQNIRTTVHVRHCLLHFIVRKIGRHFLLSINRSLPIKQQQIEWHWFWNRKTIMSIYLTASRRQIASSATSTAYRKQ